MRMHATLTLAVMMATTILRARAQTPAGDPDNGARLFRACAACHSLVPGRNMTGPSLGQIWGRKAGSLDSFARYSPALKGSAIVWGRETLDAWLQSPQSLVPNNAMNFAGIADAGQRADLIAFLKEASAGRVSPAALAQSGGMAARFRDLKKLGSARQIRAIRVCHDSYFVTTADGKTAAYWEANLRFKTDSGDTGPLRGKPVIMPAGMIGDRASVFFSSPEEISAFIKRQC